MQFTRQYVWGVEPDSPRPGFNLQLENDTINPISIYSLLRQNVGIIGIFHRIRLLHLYNTCILAGLDYLKNDGSMYDGSCDLG